MPDHRHSVVTPLYEFCSLAGCADGDGSQSRPAMDAAGNIFGIATAGGAHGGTVFEPTP